MTAKRKPFVDDIPDMEATKRHILAAGRELLLASQGALRFLKLYVEYAAPSVSRPHLGDFFSRAIEVADELAQEITRVVPVEKVARDVASSVLDAIENEMTAEERAAKPKRKAAKRSPKKKDTTKKKPAATKKTPAKKKTARKKK